MSRPPTIRTPVWLPDPLEFVKQVRIERALMAGAREQHSGDVEPGRGADSMNDTDTSTKFAKAKREAITPEVTPETSPEKPGESHGSGEYNNRLVNG